MESSLLAQDGEGGLGLPVEANSAGKELILQAYEKTKEADEVAEFNEVIELCRQGIEMGVNDSTVSYANRLMSWAHNRLGESFADDGREDEALAEFEKAIGLEPTRWRAVHNRAVSLALTGKLEEALDDLNRTIDLQNGYANAWYNRGEIYYQLGKYQEALSDYSEAIQLEPEESSYHNARGHTYYRVGQFQDAFRDINQAIRLDPQNAAALANRAEIYADLGRYGQAAESFREAIRVDGEFGRAYQGAAWLMATCPDVRYRNATVALEAAQKAIELDGEDDYHYLDTLAAALANAGDFDEAMNVQRRVVELAPENESAYLRRRLESYEANQPYRERRATAQSPIRRSPRSARSR